jgi:hypothetical protein
MADGDLTSIEYVNDATDVLALFRRPPGRDVQIGHGESLSLPKTPYSLQQQELRASAVGAK